MKYTQTEPDWSVIPEHMQEGIRNYIEHGVQSGSFLMAVLENNLIGACERADHINRHKLFNFIFFLHNYAPQDCFGSPEAVRKWMDRKGLEGG